jgi:clan AA aspartic protease
MEKTWNYSTPLVSNVPAPYVEIVVYNPERSLKYPSKGTLSAMIDTGYDGYLITPINIFNELKLDDYEIPAELIQTTETFTGERMKLRTSLAIVEIPGLLQKQIEIDAHENCLEPLLGRLFLEDLLTTLDGLQRKITISTSK